jgi:hypothetical protein
MSALNLIESGADLECRLPKDCDDIQRAIEKRINVGLHTIELPFRDNVKREANERIRIALSKRGVTVRDPDIDEPVEDTRIDRSKEIWLTEPLYDPEMFQG